MRSQPPKVTYGDSYSIGQITEQWDKSPDFVRRMIAEGKLAQDERGLITNDALRDFYSAHSTELD